MSPTEIVSQVSSDTLGQTDVSACLESGLTPGRNLICCAAFQLAWNQLADEIIKEPVELEGNPPLVQMLNKRRFGKQDISEDSYLAVAGFGHDSVVEQIKRGLREKFHQEPGFDLTLSRPDDILAYAYLEKNLPFDTKFDIFEKELLFSDGRKIRSFGIEKCETAADQVVILDYRGRDDFILKLQGSQRVTEDAEWGKQVSHPRIQDEIILAKLTPAATLLETVETVFSRMSEQGYEETGRAGPIPGRVKQRQDSNVREILQIPIINFNIEHRFAEIEGKHVLNENFDRYLIANALQGFKFKLDETGATLASEGFTRMTIGPLDVPRQFIFDKPFLLCLREKQARYPYLAVWIENSEILVSAS